MEQRKPIYADMFSVHTREEEREEVAQGHLAGLSFYIVTREACTSLKLDKDKNEEAYIEAERQIKEIDVEELHELKVLEIIEVAKAQVQ
jgi:hypothetical protein